MAPENLQKYNKDVIEKKIRVKVERNMACICTGALGESERKQYYC